MQRPRLQLRGSALAQHGATSSGWLWRVHVCAARQQTRAVHGGTCMLQPPLRARTSTLPPRPLTAPPPVLAPSRAPAFLDPSEPTPKDHDKPSNHARSAPIRSVPAGQRPLHTASDMADLPDARSASRAELIGSHMERPALDTRSYRVIRLPNKLEALLIHDADTDKASAALDCNVGSFSDRDDMPGMAHAVEHLLFMGTEKYPAENAYNQYLTAHNGSSNAFTASTSTNYFFEVAASNEPSSSRNSSRSNLLQPPPVPKSEAPLHGALDRFAQFFIRPLFLEDTLDRELKAVDSENKKNLQNDTWRLHQLNKTLSNPKHPYHHFSTGNYETLRDAPLKRGVKIRDEFIRFYEEHYSANRMKLVVLGRESLDELQSWVEELFSEVPNKDLPQNRWDGISPLTENELGTIIYAKPVYEMRTLDLYFPLPDLEHLYEVQPGRYWGHLLGHEGPGSILAYLKAKGWANGLGAGAVHICAGFELFSISVKLTEDGLKHYEAILEAIFQYIAMLREQPALQWIFDEIKTMSHVNFKYRQKSAASKTTSGLSGVMQKPYPRDWLLSGSSLLRKFDASAISEALDYVRPDNFRMLIVCQDYPGDWDQKEKWYGTEYRVERMSPALHKKLDEAYSAPASKRPSELHLPEQNDFIPARLEVDQKEVDEPLVAPKLVRNDDSVRAWWKKDDQFWVPKAWVHISLRTPLPHMTPRTQVIAAMYRDLVHDELNEYSYNAEIAGLEYSLSTNSHGLVVAVTGYNDKMHVLLEKVLLCMRDLEVREDRFQINKERLLRSYRNWEYQQPYQQIISYTHWLSKADGWINEQYLAELPHVTADDVRSFYPQMLQQCHIEVLAHGNLYKEDALTFSNLAERVLRPRNLPPSQWPSTRSLMLAPGTNFVYERTLKDTANVNHCIEYSLYIGENTDRALRAKLLLFAQCTDEPVFNTLRTNEQLGYVVFSGAQSSNTRMGYRILVQSERDPQYLEQRVEKFLHDYGTTLEEMTAQQFDKLKSSLINKRLERLKNLSQETSRFVSHILSEQYDFDRVEHDVAHLSLLSKQDMIDFHAHYIAPSSPHRAKISVHLLAQSSPADLAGSLSKEEQTEKAVEAVCKLLANHNISPDAQKLATALSSVDIQAGGSKDGIVEAVSSYLQTDEGVTDQQTLAAILEQGKALLASALPALGIQPDAPNGNTTNGDPTALNDQSDAVKGNEAEVVKIADVREWKAGMVVAPAARPTRDLSEFEEGAAKL